MANDELVQLSDLDPLTTLADGDLFFVVDISAGVGGGKYITGANLKQDILDYANSLTALTTPASDDLVTVYDTSASESKQVTLANFRDHVNVKDYGATGDGTTDDTTAITAAIAALPATGGTLLFPPGTYMVSSTVTLDVDDGTILGPGILKPSVELNRVLNVTADRATVRDLEIDGNPSNVTLSSLRGELCQVTGADCVIDNCYFHDCAVDSASAQCLQIEGCNCTVRGGVYENGGYYCIRADGQNHRIDGAVLKYTTERAGYEYRFFGNNSAGGAAGDEDFLSTLNGCRFESSLTQAFTSTWDIEASASGETRVAVIRDLTIDTPNHDGAGSSNGLLKFEGFSKVTIDGLVSNAQDSYLSSLADTTDLSDVEYTVKNSKFYGAFFNDNGYGTTKIRKAVLDNCEVIDGGVAGTRVVLSLDDVLLLVVRDTTFTSWTTQFSDSYTAESDHRIVIENVTFNFDTDSDQYLFASTPNTIETLSIKNLRINNDGTGEIYLSNTIASRLLRTSNGNDLFYDHPKEMFWPGESGTVGVRSTSATASYEQLEYTSGADAFPTITGREGQRIINMNPANGLGPGWAHNGTGWIPIAGTAYSMADADSPNNTLYYSTDQSGLTYKDSSGNTSVVSAGATQASTGSELVTNGGFDSDLSSWTAGANWAQAGGKAVHSAGSTETLTQNLTLTAGEKYYVFLTVADRTAGSILCELDSEDIIGDRTPFSTSKTSNGNTETAIVANTTGSAALTFTPSSDFDGAIDSISVKQITGTGTPAAVYIDDSGNTVAQIHAFAGTNQSIYFGDGSGAYHIGGNYNTAMGINAMSEMVTGAGNVAIGYSALKSAVSTTNQIAIGRQALEDVVGGNQNLAIGNYALQHATSGYRNCAVGYAALQAYLPRNHSPWLWLFRRRFLLPESPYPRIPVSAQLAAFRFPFPACDIHRTVRLPKIVASLAPLVGWAGACCTQTYDVFLLVYQLSATTIAIRLRDWTFHFPATSPAYRSSLAWRLVPLNSPIACPALVRFLVHVSLP